MIDRILVDNERVRVRRSLFGSIKVDIKGSRSRTFRASATERAYFNAAADEFEKSGTLRPGMAAFAQFVEEFAYAVSARGGAEWQAMFLATDPKIWASIGEAKPPANHRRDDDQYMTEVYRDAQAEVDSRGLTRNGYLLPLDLEIEAFAFANVAFQTHASWKDRPRIAFLNEGDWSTVQYPIAALGNAAEAGEFVRTWVETTQDGGIIVTDHGMGPIAETASDGAGGVEAVLKLSPDKARALFVALGGWSGDTSARIALRLAIGIATKFAGDLQAVSHIREFCQAQSVTPESFVHFERD